MTKNDLVQQVAETANVTRAEAGRLVDTVLDVIINALKAGEEVRLQGFGTFAVSATEAREGRNPRTQEIIKIPASKSARFRQGKTLRDELNGGAA